MRNRTTKIARTAATLGIAAIMTIGTGATAFAQPVGNPIVPDASGSSAGTEVADDVTGAQPLEVAERPVIAPPGGSAGIDWDSILGPLGLDSIDLGSLNQGDEDE